MERTKEEEAGVDEQNKKKGVEEEELPSKQIKRSKRAEENQGAEQDGRHNWRAATATPSWPTRVLVRSAPQKCRVESNPIIGPRSSRGQHSRSRLLAPTLPARGPRRGLPLRGSDMDPTIVAASQPIICSSC
jgi:hypothetical protein